MTEDKRKSQAEKTFDIQNRRMAKTVRNARIEEKAPLPDYVLRTEQRFLVLLAPLTELAWADGRISAHEMETIFKIAEAYRLDEEPDTFADLVNLMITRETPARIEERWREFDTLWHHLPADDRETVAFCLLCQARFIAERSSGDAGGRLRDGRIGSVEQAALQNIANGIKHARLSARQKRLDEFAANLRKAEKQNPRSIEEPAEDTVRIIAGRLNGNQTTLEAAA